MQTGCVPLWVHSHALWYTSFTALIILYSLYKNALMQLSQFWFCFLNLFSGTALYDSWTFTLYNVFFAAALTMVCACRQLK